MIGGAGNDTLTGVGGNDNANGGTGNDFITGGGGNDILRGSAGDDTLLGGGGNDLLIGDAGNDVLTGGIGNDSYRFNSANEGVDTINGYSTADDELLIRRNGAGFNSGNLSLGVLPANQFVVGSSANNANQRFIFDPVNDSLFYDSDGSGASAAVELASFSNNVNLTRFDIVVI